MSILRTNPGHFLYSLVLEVNGITWTDELEKLYTGLVKARWECFAYLHCLYVVAAAAVTAGRTPFRNSAA